MPLISFTPNLEKHLSCPPMRVAGATVQEALEAAFAANPKLRGYLLDDMGSLRKHVNVSINGRLLADKARMSDSVGEGDRLYVMQLLSGG